tara:strand:+ start:296 stop:1198 length:903 start_codon:yes stop_codon:yes gene_type:complete
MENQNYCCGFLASAEIVKRAIRRNRFLPAMSKPTSFKIGLGLLIFLPLTHFSRAEQLPAKLDLTSLPATFIDEVIVPNPDEVFSLMDKLPGQPDWSSKVRKDFEVSRPGNRTTLALIFGTLIADGFVAVQAEDTEGVKNAGREILALSKTLGLEEAVVPHCNAIISACQNRLWDEVRGEFDQTHKTVKETMAKMRDEQLAQCVSVSGWVRGTEVLTGLVEDGYSPEKAEILHQPDLAAHFVKQLEAMDQKTIQNPAMQSILTGLREVSLLMRESQELSAPAVAQIHEICSKIQSTIQSDK